MHLPVLSMWIRAGRRRGLGWLGALALLLPAVLLSGGSSPPGQPVGAEVVATATATAGATDPPIAMPPRRQPSGAVTARGTRDRAAAAGPGAILAWGYNLDGELGDGTQLDSSTAVAVQGISGAVSLAPGSNALHSLAIRRDGSVAAWGYGDFGQLGVGAPFTSLTALGVISLPANDPVVAVAAGGIHSLALTTSGAVYAWGDNTAGQVGQGATSPTPVAAPLPVKGVGGVGTLGGIVAIAAGNTHNLAVAGSGTVYAWGGNFQGQLGDTTVLTKTLPVAVSGLNLGNCAAAGANCAVAAGTNHSLARAADGNVFAWGRNTSGQLGDGTNTTPRTAPVAVLPLSGLGQLNARSVAAGNAFSLAVANDGTALAWGNGGAGQLGDGLATNRNHPAAVTVEAGGAPLTGVTALAGGGTHGLALMTGGTVFAWGAGTVSLGTNAGQVGDGTLLQRNRAVPVLNVAGVTTLAAGAFHSLALGPDFPFATVTPQPTATPASTATPQPTATAYVYTPPAASAAYYPITPVRVLDTRASDPPGILHVGFDENGNVTPSTPIQPGVARRFKVAGQTFAGTTIPASAQAIDLNVTALPTTGFGGFLTIFPGNVPDAQRPLSSALNPIQAINNNFFSTTLGPVAGPNAGSFAAYSQAVPLDLVIDVVGYYQ